MRIHYRLVRLKIWHIGLISDAKYYFARLCINVNKFRTRKNIDKFDKTSNIKYYYRVRVLQNKRIQMINDASDMLDRAEAQISACVK